MPAGAVRLTGGRLNQDTTLLLKGVGHASCPNEDPPKTSDLQQTPHVHVAYAVPWDVSEFLEQALRAEPKTSDLQQTPHVHVAYAVPWDVSEFLEQALRAEHPRDKMSSPTKDK